MPRRLGSGVWGFVVSRDGRHQIRG
jgi:hypothetical protein